MQKRILVVTSKILLFLSVSITILFSIVVVIARWETINHRKGLSNHDLEFLVFPIYKVLALIVFATWLFYYFMKNKNI
jgi:uncharacterized BrkB/YihY/UPF0761 family membrane protein